MTPRLLFPLLLGGLIAAAPVLATAQDADVSPASQAVLDAQDAAAQLRAAVAKLSDALN